MTPLQPKVEELERRVELLIMTVQRIEADTRGRLFYLEEQLKKTKHYE